MAHRDFLSLPKAQVDNFIGLFYFTLKRVPVRTVKMFFPIFSSRSVFSYFFFFNFNNEKKGKIVMNGLTFDLSRTFNRDSDIKLITPTVCLSCGKKATRKTTQHNKGGN